MKLDEMIPFEQIMEEELQDPEFRAEWDERRLHAQSPSVCWGIG